MIIETCVRLMFLINLYDIPIIMTRQMNRQVQIELVNYANLLPYLWLFNVNLDQIDLKVTNLVIN